MDLTVTFRIIPLSMVRRMLFICTRAQHRIFIILRHRICFFVLLVFCRARKWLECNNDVIYYFSSQQPMRIVWSSDMLHANRIIGDVFLLKQRTRREDEIFSISKYIHSRPIRSDDETSKLSSGGVQCADLFPLKRRLNRL